MAFTALRATMEAESSEEPVFHEPVSITVGDDGTCADIVAAHVAALPPSGLGGVVGVDPVESRRGPALPGWTGCLPEAELPGAPRVDDGAQRSGGPGVDDGVAPTSGPRHDDGAQRRGGLRGGEGARPPGGLLDGDLALSTAWPVPATTARASRRSAQPAPEGSSLCDDAPEGDMGGDAAPSQPSRHAPSIITPRRANRPALQLPSPITMTEALTACVRRARGLPSSTRVSSAASRVVATVVGDPSSRSRAIILRHGTAKRDAIVWVSAMGGLICSCFSGTQNGQLLPVCARSTDCQHVALLKRCIVLSGVSLPKLQRRMQLQDRAADFGNDSQYGPTVVWTVLYKSIFSLVTFSLGGVAMCIAPGCRRFRGRCGHVRVARPLNAARKELATADHLMAGRGGPTGRKQAKPSADYPSFVVSAEEDEGVKKLPGDTLRSKEDADKGAISKRVPRNLLPSVGEVADGDAWARTADCSGLPCRTATLGDQHDPEDVKLMGQLYASLARKGHVRDINEVLVEPYCGSCGTNRQDSHAVIIERGTIFMHHPMAPVVQVSMSNLTVAHVCLFCGRYGRALSTELSYAPHLNRFCSWLPCCGR